MKTYIRACFALLAATAVLAGGKFTEEQLKARYYFDLGPAQVDVSGYPKRQQENYQLFAKTCSQCHTLARPINAPITSRSEWRRFIRRMHARIKSKVGSQFDEEQAERIVDFLTYDAQVRKVAAKAAFDAQSAGLKELFKEAQAERLRQAEKDSESKARPYVDDTQASPQPQP